MKNFTEQASEALRTEKSINLDNLKIGDNIKAFTGNSAFADCMPIDSMATYTIAKINKKNIKTICGKNIPKINIRKIL